MKRRSPDAAAFASVAAATGAPILVAARRIASPVAARHEFTYAVLREPVAPHIYGERRDGCRRRTRLRSGKIIDADGHFVVECLIANRSASGGMLRLPGSMALPGRILLYDDQSGELQAASVIWRRDREIGIRFTPVHRSERHRAIADSMRRKFYAMQR